MIEFSCCSSYALCNYGRGECLYVKEDPTAMERCRCYKLKKREREQKSEVKGIKGTQLEFHKQIESDKEQLSLF